MAAGPRPGAALHAYFSVGDSGGAAPAALDDLAALAEQVRSPQRRSESIRQLSVLLKRVALAAYPRIGVASLYGDDWLTFLDQQIGGNHFSKGIGRVLAAAMADPNAGADLSITEWDGLIDQVRHWITAHRVEDSPPEPTEAGG
jgi:Ca-activated chloride channel family protein